MVRLWVLINHLKDSLLLKVVGPILDKYNYYPKTITSELYSHKHNESNCFESLSYHTKILLDTHYWHEFHPLLQQLQKHNLVSHFCKIQLLDADFANLIQQKCA